VLTSWMASPRYYLSLLELHCFPLHLNSILMLFISSTQFVILISASLWDIVVFVVCCNLWNSSSCECMLVRSRHSVVSSGQLTNYIIPLMQGPKG
jgi:hypothetical protein